MRRQPLGVDGDKLDGGVLSGGALLVLLATFAVALMRGCG